MPSQTQRHWLGLSPSSSGFSMAVSFGPEKNDKVSLPVLEKFWLSGPMKDCKTFVEAFVVVVVVVVPEGGLLEEDGVAEVVGALVVVVVVVVGVVVEVELELAVVLEVEVEVVALVFSSISVMIEQCNFSSFSYVGHGGQSSTANPSVVVAIVVVVEVVLVDGVVVDVELVEVGHSGHSGQGLHVGGSLRAAICDNFLVRNWRVLDD